MSGEGSDLPYATIPYEDWARLSWKDRCILALSERDRAMSALVAEQAKMRSLRGALTAIKNAASRSVHLAPSTLTAIAEVATEALADTQHPSTPETTQQPKEQDHE